MSTAHLARIVAATVVAVVTLVLASVMTTGRSERTRPPLGEVRIEKIVDFQLPVLELPVGNDSSPTPPIRGLPLSGTTGSLE